MRNLLQGERIKITALKEDDKSVLEQWFNDAAFMRNYDIIPAVPQHGKGIEEIISYYEDSEKLIMGVRLKDNNELIGVVGFDDIYWNNGTSFLFIGIGDTNFRGKGYGEEAINLLIDYGFNEMNFHKLQLNVIEYNSQAVKLYEKVGFVREGIYREYVQRDGRRYHLYLYGMLRSEWKGPDSMR